MRKLTKKIHNWLNWLMMCVLGIIIGLMLRRYQMKNMDKHHIIPSSRGGRGGANLARVNKHKHAIYHMLFCNMTPDEIIVYLVEKFWNNQWEWIEKALERRK